MPQIKNQKFPKKHKKGPKLFLNKMPLLRNEDYQANLYLSCSSLRFETFFLSEKFKLFIRLK